MARARESFYERWWRKKGFAEPPERKFSNGGELVYRVGGGPHNLALGSFFSPLKARSVSDADLRANIIWWRNRCYYVATYRLKPLVPYWKGRMAHGANDIADRSAVQFYIEHPLGSVALVRDVEPLRQDFFVSPFSGRA